MRSALNGRGADGLAAIEHATPQRGGKAGAGGAGATCSERPSMATALMTWP